MDQTPSFSPGHNARALLTFDEVRAFITPEIIVDHLSGQFASMLERSQDLLNGVARFHESYKGGIPDDEIAAKLTSFVKQIKTTAKDVEAQRGAVRRPFDDAVKAIDGFLKSSVSDRLTDAARGLERVLGDYQARKASEERARREARAAAAAAEASRASAEALRTQEISLLDRAVEAASAADTAARAAAAPTRDLGRTRGSMGGTAQLRKHYDFEVSDLSKVPLAFITVNRSLLLGHIRASKGEVEIPGIKIIVTDSTVVA